MSFSDARDLLWLAGISYSFAFTVGFLKTFKLEFMPLKDGPLVFIVFGFFVQTRALYLRGLKYMVAHSATPWNGSIYSLVIDSYLSNPKSFMASKLTGHFLCRVICNCRDI